MCGGSKWKREVVPDHKFDFIDTREFTDHGFIMRMKYLWLYLIVLKSFMVYILDIFSAVTMLSTEAWSNEIFNQCKDLDGCVFIPFKTGRWLFVGCIIFSFLLLAYESRKAKKIIASRDISYAFTNVMANHYYSLRSYDHFCFFDHISNSTKTSDDFAFFVFFTFKSWKQVLLADAPRQTINALTLYAIYLVKRDNEGNWYDIGKYFANNKSISTSLLTVTTFLTVLVFAGSLLLLVAAGICYIPLLCRIQGNLKEYCCHKVDKRIGTIIKRRQKQRLADAAKLAQKEAQGDFSHLKNKKGELIAKPLPQPTLPNLSVDDDVDDKVSMHTRTAPSTYTQDYYYYNSDKNSTMTGDYPPPMPAYNPYSTHQPPGSYAHFQSSSASFSHEDPGYTHHQMYDDDNDSTAHLSSAAAPFSQQPPPDRGGSTKPYPYPGGNGNSSYDPHDVYQGRAAPNHDVSRRHLPPSNGGIAYDDASHYSGASLPGYGGQPTLSADNPYGGYSSNPGTPQGVQSHQQPRRGQGYEGGGGYSRAL
ncbi:hypothetical protein Hypma_010321 [Hypsizygus marmoreus]|uniref:Vacuole protein n=1 Tax=Hypsizygus marmoreus TaxID=39966 RepID=A0A369JL10_HYPMA|nr:hypothetical protein Hypma_010321 [Hypsizygus marmoreus]